MRNLRPLWPYVRRHRLPLLAGLLVAATAALVGIIPPVLLGRAVKTLKDGNVDLQVLLNYSLMILGVALCSSLLGFGIRRLIGGTSYVIENEIRTDLFGQFMRLDQQFYGEHHTGDLMARSTNDLSSVRQMLGQGLIQICGPGLLVLAASAMMISIDWRLALVALTMLPLISISFVVIGKRMRERFSLVQTQFGHLSTRAQENFSGIRTIKAYAQERHEIDDFRRANEDYRRLNLRYVLLDGLIWPMMALLIGLTAGLILLVGGQAVASGRIDLQQFVQFNGYVGLLTWPMIALGWTVTLYQQGSASLQRINEILTHQPTVRSPASPARPAAWQGAVEFRGVGVRYGDHWVVRDISLSVPAGGSLAIVGATGAGKTTLINLLGRVQDPTEGAVLVDGHNVRDLPLDELRQHIGYVSQDTFLFSVPLKENVTFGRPDATAAQIDDALLVSQLVNDVPQFPEGLETLLGERGVTLSGGQKQRAAIARAILRDPTILVLDDAMSSVDTHTAAEILRQLRRVMTGRTSIIIAQRIATVKEADTIVVLHKGQIAERGTHAELVKHNGLYAAMYRRELLQSEMEVVESDR